MGKKCLSLTTTDLAFQLGLWEISHGIIRNTNMEPWYFHIILQFVTGTSVSFMLITSLKIIVAIIILAAGSYVMFK